MIGTADSDLMRGARTSADRHSLRVQEWTAEEVARRVPALRPAREMTALFEPRAGVLDPERAVAAMLGQAEAAGATLHFDTEVAAWQPAGRGVELITGDGRRVASRQVVLAAGGWLPTLAGLDLPLTVERAPQFWFPTTGDARFAPAHFPVFLLETPDRRLLYGLPDQGLGLKLAEHHRGEVVALETMVREVSAEEGRAFRAFAAPWVAELAEEPAEASVCFYTNTPDGHFLIDRHPRWPAVYLLSACSGHGFKFAPALGELVAQDLTDGSSPPALAPFRLTRFD
jgi:sarcosine oxidase